MYMLLTFFSILEEVDVTSLHLFHVTWILSFLTRKKKLINLYRKKVNVKVRKGLYRYNKYSLIRNRVCGAKYFLAKAFPYNGSTDRKRMNNVQFPYINFRCRDVLI